MIDQCFPIRRRFVVKEEFFMTAKRIRKVLAVIMSAVMAFSVGGGTYRQAV